MLTARSHLESIAASVDASFSEKSAVLESTCEQLSSVLERQHLFLQSAERSLSDSIGTRDELASTVEELTRRLDTTSATFETALAECKADFASNVAKIRAHCNEAVLLAEERAAHLAERLRVLAPPLDCDTGRL